MITTRSNQKFLWYFVCFLHLVFLTRHLDAFFKASYLHDRLVFCCHADPWTQISIWCSICRSSPSCALACALTLPCIHHNIKEFKNIYSANEPVCFQLTWSVITQKHRIIPSYTHFQIFMPHIANYPPPKKNISRNQHVFLSVSSLPQ